MFSILRKLSWFFKENWKRYTVAITLLVFIGFVDVIPPKLVGMVIDDIHMGVISKEKIVQYLLAFFVLTVVSYGVTYIWMYQ